MSDDASMPVQTGSSSPTETNSTRRVPTTSDFWEEYGWNTTYSLCVGIGAFGFLQFLIGLVCTPTHPILDVAEMLVLFATAPILVTAGLTGFSLPIYSLIKHHWFDDQTSE